MKNMKKSLPALILTGAILGAGFTPAASAATSPAALAAVVKPADSLSAAMPAAKKATPVQRIYVTNMQSGPRMVKVAGKTFKAPLSDSESVTVPAGASMSAEFLSGSTSLMTVNGKKYVVDLSVAALKNLMVKVPRGDAKTAKQASVYSKSTTGKVVGTLKKGSKLTTYGFSNKGRTLVDYNGERAWVATSALKAGSYTVRETTRDAIVYVYSYGVMFERTNRIERRIKKGTKFMVLDRESYETGSSSASTEFYFGSEGGIRAVDSKKHSVRKHKLTTTTTLVK